MYCARYISGFEKSLGALPPRSFTFGWNYLWLLVKLLHGDRASILPTVKSWQKPCDDTVCMYVLGTYSTYIFITWLFKNGYYTAKNWTCMQLFKTHHFLNKRVVNCLHHNTLDLQEVDPTSTGIWWSQNI